MPQGSTGFRSVSACSFWTRPRIRCASTRHEALLRGHSLVSTAIRPPMNHAAGGVLLPAHRVSARDQASCGCVRIQQLLALPRPPSTRIPPRLMTVSCLAQPLDFALYGRTATPVLE